jgi:flagellar biosynthesis protein FliR
MELVLPIYPITLLLILFRFVAVIGMSAIFGRSMIPARIRLALALALTWFTVMRLPLEWQEYCQGLTTAFPLVVAIFGEIMLGLALGMVCELFFAVLNVSGTLVGQASSLMMAQMVDPTSDQQDVILSTLFSLLFTLLVLLWDGHLFLIKMVVQSFQLLPPGFAWFRQELLEMYVQLGGNLFSWGIRYALPVMMGGLVIGVAMGLMAKMAPEFNVMFLALPIRLGMGIGLFSIFMLYAADPLYKIFEAMMLHLRFVLLGGVT